MYNIKAKNEETRAPETSTSFDCKRFAEAESMQNICLHSDAVSRHMVLTPVYVQEISRLLQLLLHFASPFLNAAGHGC